MYLVPNSTASSLLPMFTCAGPGAVALLLLCHIYLQLQEDTVPHRNPEAPLFGFLCSPQNDSPHPYKPITTSSPTGYKIKETLGLRASECIMYNNRVLSISVPNISWKAHITPTGNPQTWSRLPYRSLSVLHISLARMAQFAKVINISLA